MANVTYTVVKGDNLTKIAAAHNTTVAKLVELNNIADPNYIVVGQVLVISGTATPATKATDTTKVTIDVFGLQSDTDRTVYVRYLWSKWATTEHCLTQWYYDTGDGMWFIGDEYTDDKSQGKALYNAPSNAKRVMFKVIPVAKKKTVNGKEVAYWTAQWSEFMVYDFDDNPPVTPNVPSVKIEKYKLTATLDNIEIENNDDGTAPQIQFQVVKDDSTLFASGSANVVTYHASYSTTITAGGAYKVRCRAVRNNKYSDWTDYSDNYNTIPAVPTGLTAKAKTSTSAYLTWDAVDTAETYDIQYTTELRYFDTSKEVTDQTGIEYTNFEMTGLTTGDEYFFRVRATNKEGSSGWSSVCSTAVGKKPAAPTTWSSTTTAIVGEKITLYWIHNSADNSSETYADLEILIGDSKETHTIKKSEDEDEKDKTSFFEIDTSDYIEGTKISWRVRTSGATKEFGEWSIQRTIDVYAPVTLSLNVTDKDANPLEVITGFPFYVRGLAGPNTQIPLGYNLTITSNQIYETVDQIGSIQTINKGEQVYSKYFDTTDALLVELTAGNIDLQNGMSYTVTCVVSMNSGLTKEASTTITVSWDEVSYAPNAEIGIDPDAVVAYIRPYCEDVDGNRIEGVSLNVYRREFDGTFTEIISGIDNMSDTYITDPHPALDYARYRIVAVTDATGAVSYYDPPGYPVGEVAAIIQWDEDWTYFDTTNSDMLEQPAWAGSLLRLPYNIDVSSAYSPDVSLVNYIGRKHPVTYYGTQIGETAKWNMDIIKDDEETLYALRRLAIWMGDVYVREPSGSGYWANVTVSFSQKHKELTIPVSLDITRVEGGI